MHTIIYILPLILALIAIHFGSNKYTTERRRQAKQSIIFASAASITFIIAQVMEWAVRAGPVTPIEYILSTLWWVHNVLMLMAFIYTTKPR
jgi:heme/copper-type cytochrome/quinol oxidase subunit 3